MAKKNIIKGAVAALALLTGINAYGQQVISNSQKVDENKFRSTIDFMYDTTLLNKINRNETTNLKEQVSGNFTEVYALDAVEGLKKAITYLNSVEGKSFYGNGTNYKGQNPRLMLIEKYNNYIKELSKVAPADKESLEALTAAGSDLKINPTELVKVKDGFYVLELGNKLGYVFENDNTKNPYRVFYLAEVVSNKTPAQYEANISELEKRIAKLSKQTTPDVSLDVAKPKANQYPLASPTAPLQTPTVPSTAVSKALPKCKEDTYEQTGRINRVQPNPNAQNSSSQSDNQSKNVPIDFIFGLNTTPAFDFYSANAGIRVSPFDNGMIGFSALVNAGIGADKVTDSASVTYFDPVFNSDVTMSGTKKNTNNFSLGGSLELNIGPIVAGIGLKYNSFIEKTSEQITAGTTVLNSNLNSKFNSSLSENLYGGLEIAITDSYKIGAIAEYDTLNGFSFGLRNDIKLNPPQKKN